MTITLLDFSQRPELGLHAAVMNDVQAAAHLLGIKPVVVGAFARDLQLSYAHGIAMQRKTADLDIALAVPTWSAFNALKEQLLQAQSFIALPRAAHRLKHRSGLPLDLVPFGPVETSSRTIVWPPSGEVTMDVFGFQEALTHPTQVVLPGPVPTQVVALAGLALLKLVCWQDRHRETPGKDASDLLLITRHYLLAGNEARLWNEFSHWTHDAAFDYEQAGARLLGHDIRALLDEHGAQRVGRLLSTTDNAINVAKLSNQMLPHQPERAALLLAMLLRGLLEAQ